MPPVCQAGCFAEPNTVPSHFCVPRPLLALWVSQHALGESRAPIPLAHTLAPAHPLRQAPTCLPTAARCMWPTGSAGAQESWGQSLAFAPFCPLCQCFAPGVCSCEAHEQRPGGHTWALPWHKVQLCLRPAASCGYVEPISARAGKCHCECSWVKRCMRHGGVPCLVHGMVTESECQKVSRRGGAAGRLKSDWPSCPPVKRMRSVGGQGPEQLSIADAGGVAGIEGWAGSERAAANRFGTSTAPGTI